ncbi:hypothetical protein DB346_20180 [Verrucomicrobia bacterium LW23]|nr:hypothetical protein DB346_20180 [Verrucomicrobia bacterium LW23]
MPSPLLKNPYVLRLIPPIAEGIIRTMGFTMRMRYVDPDKIKGKKDRGPLLFSFWHNRFLLMPYLFQHMEPERRAVVMISRSWDGEIISSVANRFGIHCARGSTSKAGQSAFHEMVNLVTKEGYDAAITPDGPRGPRYSVQPGILHLAQITGCPIVPITYHLNWKLETRSWDKFQIPIPGSVCTLQAGRMIHVPRGAGATEMKVLAEELRVAMGE